MGPLGYDHQAFYTTHTLALAQGPMQRVKKFWQGDEGFEESDAG